ncbi:MAG: DUF4352 domain-containing protein [Nitrospiria bacterium]
MKSRFPLYVFVLLFALALACGNSSNRGGQQESAAGDGAAQGEQAEEIAPAVVGQDVMVGDIRWKVLEARELGQELKSDNEFMEPKKTSGKFVMMRFEIENRKSEAVTYAGIELVDDKERTFKHYSEQFGYIDKDETCVLEQLNPNISRTCTEIFELPADARGIKAKVGDLELFGGDEVLIDLGF